AQRPPAAQRRHEAGADHDDRESGSPHPGGGAERRTPRLQLRGRARGGNSGRIPPSRLPPRGALAPCPGALPARAARGDTGGGEGAGRAAVRVRAPAPVAWGASSPLAGVDVPGAVPAPRTGPWGAPIVPPRPAPLAEHSLPASEPRSGFLATTGAGGPGYPG